MERSDTTIYKVLSLVMLAAIAAVIVFVIIPKYSPATPEKIIQKIDFSTPAWIEVYVEKTVGTFGNDFYHSTAFSYNIRSNKMIATYASQKSIEEAREYYLALPGAELSGRNDETSLNITAEEEGQKLRVYNYFSPVSRVFELELTLARDTADQIISQLDKAFPAQELAKISQVKDILSGEFFGGYVRYRYDNLDEFTYPEIPIFSRAFLFDGTGEEYGGIIAEMDAAYPDHRFDETQNTHYYKISGQIVSLSFLVTDSKEQVVSISIQAERKGE